MKVLSIIVPLFFFAAAESMAQPLSKIEIGMTPDEVKKELGNPKAVEAGFPDTDELQVDAMPEQHGQLNYTTWFYFFSPFYSYNKVKIAGTVVYKINGTECTKDIFDDYKDSGMLFMRNSEIISHGMADGYRYLKDPDLKTITITSRSRKEIGGYTKTVKISNVTVYCVIFDRGTQVVADKRQFVLQTPLSK